MLHTESDAARWERGCKSDAVRNQFVIPATARLLNRAQPREILDVGAGTGYIARMVDSQLSYRPRWTIVDNNAERLTLAEALQPPGMILSAVVDDIMQPRHVVGPFGAVLTTFTILELPDTALFARIVSGFTAPDAPLIVVIPDAWHDVLTYSAAQPDIVAQYLAGPISIPKVDKFTGSEYPFHVVRTERLIGTIMNAGFQLCEISQCPSDIGGAFLMVFKRTAG